MGKEVKNIDIMDLDEVVEIVNHQVVDLMHSIPRTRSPKTKRMQEKSLKFWGNISYYLKIVAAMSDDEFLSLEEKMKEVSNG